MAHIHSSGFVSHFDNKPRVKANMYERRPPAASMCVFVRFARESAIKASEIFNLITSARRRVRCFALHLSWKQHFNGLLIFLFD